MYVFPLLHFRLMENLTQKDPVWRENGKAFVESVTRLLERLLDYRNVGQVGTFLPFFHLNPIGPDVYFEHFEKLRFLEKNNTKNLF